MDIMPMATIFMIGFALAITVNYPNLEEQTKRLKAYAGEVLMIVTLIFSAGCFTGILSETKMITEMAKTLVSLIPEHMGSLLPLSVAVTSMPACCRLFMKWQLLLASIRCKSAVQLCLGR